MNYNETVYPFEQLRAVRLCARDGLERATSYVLNGYYCLNKSFYLVLL